MHKIVSTTALRVTFSFSLYNCDMCIMFNLWRKNGVKIFDFSRNVDYTINNDILDIYACKKFGKTWNYLENTMTGKIFYRLLDLMPKYLIGQTLTETNIGTKHWTVCYLKIVCTLH